MAKETKKEFNKRAFASVFGGFAFIVMALTGLGLFSAPSCRIARDTSWSVWGYSKEELVALHVLFAITFVIVAIYHIYLNWASIKKYFEGKASQGIGFRTEWVVALIVCVLIYGGTLHGAWPFSSLIEWKESYKHAADGQGGQGQGRRGGRGGAGRLQSFERESQTRSEPRRESEDQQGGRARGRGGQFQGQDGQPRGMGQMTLSEFCRSEGIELRRAIAKFRDEGIAVEGEMTMREIANASGIHPRELRTILGVE